MCYIFVYFEQKSVDFNCFETMLDQNNPKHTLLAPEDFSIFEENNGKE